MPASARHVWLNVSQRPARRYAARSGVVLALLTGGALAVAYRTTLCQLQAYAILLLSIVALGLAVQHASLRRECTVEVLRSPYCIECKGESRAAMVIGQFVSAVSSNYERFYMRVPRLHLALVAWLAWIAYGSLFHGARHNAAEDAYVARVAAALSSGAVGSAVAAHLREARVVVLWLNALYSLLVEHWRVRTIGTPVHQQQQSAAHRALQSTGLFFALLFAPTAESTAQSLSPLSALARTALFAALFFADETLGRAHQYAAWINSYTASYRVQLVGLLMALGSAKPHRPSKSRQVDDVVIPLHGAASASPIVGRRFSLDGKLAEWAVVVRCAWLLVANNGALALGLVQLALTLALLAVVRRDTLRTARAKYPLLQTDSERAAPPRRRMRPPWRQRPADRSPLAEPTPVANTGAAPSSVGVDSPTLASASAAPRRPKRAHRPANGLIGSVVDRASPSPPLPTPVGHPPPQQQQQQQQQQRPPPRTLSRSTPLPADEFLLNDKASAAYSLLSRRSDSPKNDSTDTHGTDVPTSPIDSKGTPPRRVLSETHAATESGRSLLPSGREAARVNAALAALQKPPPAVPPSPSPPPSSPASLPSGAARRSSPPPPPDPTPGSEPLEQLPVRSRQRRRKPAATAAAAAAAGKPAARIPSSVRI